MSKFVTADLSILQCKKNEREQTTNACLRNVLSTEIRDNGIDKIVSHDDRADRFPVAGIFAKQQADRLQCDLHDRRWIRHGANLD